LNEFKGRPNGFKGWPNGFKGWPNGFKEWPNGFKGRPNGFKRPFAAKKPSFEAGGAVLEAGRAMVAGFKEDRTYKTYGTYAERRAIEPPSRYFKSPTASPISSIGKSVTCSSWMP
jgi:hypothetical protein